MRHSHWLGMGKDVNKVPVHNRAAYFIWSWLATLPSWERQTHIGRFCHPMTCLPHVGQGKLEKNAQCQRQLATRGASPPSGQLWCAAMFHVSFAKASLEKRGAISAIILSFLSDQEMMHCSDTTAASSFWSSCLELRKFGLNTKN